MLGYKKKAKVFFIPCLSKLCQISANLKVKILMLHVSNWKHSKRKAKERRTQGEKYAQGEKYTRGEKYSKRKVTLNTFCCAGHVAGINPLTLVVFVNNRVLTPGTFLEKKEKKKII